ncbi:MAG TPA: hypothetical protein PKC76_02970 [Saprospiraceae bacterium]|nr:hypothetical protein [Saprospiraceae bacterium]HMP23064.1 hypothetical protein [Saprospiraceae bacterium]
MKKLFLINIFVSMALCAWSQSMDTSPFVAQRLHKEKIGMMVLGSWAIGNIAAGAVLAGQRQGEDKYFHLMNIGWNTVNLSLATFGYLHAIHTDPTSFDLQGAMAGQYRVEKILLLNTGLDVGYVLGGLYLIERAKNTDQRPERLSGFGKSIILQGSFLFVFDLASYLVHARTRSSEWQQLFSNLYFNGTEAGIVWQF